MNGVQILKTMTFNSLNTIIDDILLIVRDNNISESENLSRIQIEQWIHQYRAYLIKQVLILRQRGRVLCLLKI